MARDADGRLHATRDANGFFTSYENDGRFVSYFGDNHPRYAGNVVKAMASAKHGFRHIVSLFSEEIASSNSPMQCMMKEICAQCLQNHVDPATGQETIIFSCFNQDQEMDRVDFVTLAARLRQTSVQETLSNLWLDHLLRGQTLTHV